MRSPAIDVQGFWEIFGGSTTFFPQATIDVKFENGTSTGPLNWLAFYNSPGDPGPLETGGDFYNFFVLGLYPAAYYEQFDLTGSDDTTNGTEPTATEEPVEEATPPPAPPQPTSWGNIGYPARADVIQPDLGTTGAGVITGYFFNDTKLGVLSLPSFDEAGEAIGNFSNTIHEFILRSKAAGMKKILVDVQENSGGNSFLAIDAFKQVSYNLRVYFFFAWHKTVFWEGRKPARSRFWSGPVSVHVSYGIKQSQPRTRNARG